MNTIFVLSFENEDDRRSHSNYYLPNAKIIDCIVMINGKNVFDQPRNNNFKTNNNYKTF